MGSSEKIRGHENKARGRLILLIRMRSIICNFELKLVLRKKKLSLMEFRLENSKSVLLVVLSIFAHFSKSCIIIHCSTVAHQ